MLWKKVGFKVWDATMIMHENAALRSQGAPWHCSGLTGFPSILVCPRQLGHCQSQVAAAENETYLSKNKHPSNPQTIHVTATSGQTFAASKSFCSCSVVCDQLSWILPTNAHMPLGHTVVVDGNPIRPVLALDVLRSACERDPPVSGLVDEPRPKNGKFSCSCDWKAWFNDTKWF